MALVPFRVTSSHGAGQGTRGRGSGSGSRTRWIPAVGTILSAILYGVTSRDPLTILAGIGILTLGAAVAAFVPARRAARVASPVDALRENRSVPSFPAVAS
jgi:hypothetical protein